MAKHIAFNPDCPDCRKQMAKPRIYKGGKAMMMARHSGWAMARKPGCIPFTITEKEWAALPLAE